MSRALIVCGSARAGGVTETMCLAAHRTLSEGGWQVGLVSPSRLDVRHCTDCRMCAEGACVIEDDMSSVYGMFSNADLLILATPIHFSGPSSLIKTVMDRFQTYWYHDDLPHPRYAAALLCGGSASPRFDITESIMRAFSLTTGMEWMGQLEIPDRDAHGLYGVVESTSGFIGSLMEECKGI